MTIEIKNPVISRNKSEKHTPFKAQETENKKHTYAQKLVTDSKSDIEYFHSVHVKDKANIVEIDKKAISNDIENKLLLEIDRISLSDEYSPEDKEQLIEKTIFALKCSIANIQNKINNVKDEIRDKEVNNTYANHPEIERFIKTIQKYIEKTSRHENNYLGIIDPLYERLGKIRFTNTNKSILKFLEKINVKAHINKQYFETISKSKVTSNSLANKINILYNIETNIFSKMLLELGSKNKEEIRKNLKQMQEAVAIVKRSVSDKGITYFTNNEEFERYKFLKQNPLCNLFFEEHLEDLITLATNTGITNKSTSSIIRLENFIRETHDNIIKNKEESNINLKEIKKMCKEGDLGVVKQLKYRDINTKIDNYSILYRATFHSQPKLVEFLLKKGADVDSGTLKLAYRKGHKEIINMLKNAIKKPACGEIAAS